MAEPESPEDGRKVLQEEFERAAQGFAERTRGRFSKMNVVEFSRLEPGGTIVEIGAGTGHFISLFEGVAGYSLALDITPGMLEQARRDHPHLGLVVGDGARLPLKPESFDLVMSAQALHHVFEPIPFLREMRRIAGARGHVLIVDQQATERYEEVIAMNEVETIRDPSHAASRPRSAFLMLLQAAGLELVAERTHEDRSTFSKWMWPGEFPQERIDAVRKFVEERGSETGMDFEKIDDEWHFTRRRLMILARKA